MGSSGAIPPATSSPAAPSVVRIEDGTSTALAALFPPQNDGNNVNSNSLTTIAQLLAFNGNTFDRIRTASALAMAAQSGLGALSIAPVGEWSVTHSPAIGAQATISRAAGAAGIRHIGRRVSFGFSSSAALGGASGVTFNLRDGASGLGAILKSWGFTLPAAIIAPFAISFEIDDVGSAATAMTLEMAAAVAGLQGFVNLSGFDAS